MKTLLLILVLSCVEFGQTAEPQKSDIVTTPNGQKFVLWTPNCSMCDRYTADGVAYHIFETPEYTLSFEMADDKDYYVANVFLVNKSGKRIEFDPTRSSIAVWTESDGKSRNPSAIYSPIPAEKIASKIERRAKWANFFTALGGATARRTSTDNTAGNARITDNYGNSANGTYTSQSTVTTNDTAAQQRASDQIAANNRRAADTASGYVGNDLKANTLFPNDKIGGNIYFPRKKFQKVMLGVFVEGVLHIITYLPPDKK